MTTVMGRCPGSCLTPSNSESSYIILHVCDNNQLSFSNSYDDGFKPPAEIMEAAKKWYRFTRRSNSYV